VPVDSTQRPPLRADTLDVPSAKHEVLLELFRRRPALALELARPVSPDRLTFAQISDSTLGDLVPTERKADLVLLFSRTPGGAPELAVVVEVQLAVDAEKRRSWWWYVVAVHTRHACDTVLVVVAPSASVATWAARPIALGHPGASLAPVVIGPDVVPVAQHDAGIAASPELAVLSAVVHGHSVDAEAVGRAALAAVRSLDAERAALYTDLIFASVSAEARVILEELMASGTYEYQSDFALRYVAKGREEGREEGRALAVLRVLAVRGVEVPGAIRERVLACRDASLLDEWLTRAVSAVTTSDVFGA